VSLTRINPSGESLFPVGEKLFDLGKIVFAFGQILFALGEILFRLKQIVFGLGEVESILREIVSGIGEILLALGKILFASGEILFRLKQIVFGFCEVEFVFRKFVCRRDVTEQRSKTKTLCYSSESGSGSTRILIPPSSRELEMRPVEKVSSFRPKNVGVAVAATQADREFYCHDTAQENALHSPPFTR